MEKAIIIRRLIAETNMNEKAFAIAAGIPYTTLRSILERGVGKSSTDNAIKICQALGIRVEDLEDMAYSKKLSMNQLQKKIPERQQKTINRYIAINAKEKVDDYVDMVFSSEGHSQEPTNVIDFTQYKNKHQEMMIAEETVEYTTSKTLPLHGKVSAGTGAALPQEDYYDTIEYLGNVPKHDLALMISGDSMEPVFEDGEIIFIKKQPHIENGQIGVVTIGGEGFVKKVYVENYRLRLVSLNKDYKDIITTREDVQIVGKVIM